jgi:hypothetical protein
MTGTALQAAFSGFTGAANNIQQQQAAIAQQQQYAMEMQTKWNIAKKQADDEAKMRQAAGIINMQQLEARQTEINEAATVEKMDIQIAAMKAKAAAELSASEGGVGGTSVARLLNSISSEASRKISNVESTRENQISAAQADKVATRQGTKVQPLYGILPSAGSGKVNYLPAFLSGLGAGSQHMDFSGVTDFFSGKRSQTSSATVRNPLYR